MTPNATLVSDGTRVYGMVGCKVHAVSLATGVEAWSSAVPASGAEDCNPYSSTIGTVVLADGAILAGTFNATAAFEATTGVLRWRSNNGSGFAPVVSGGVVVVPVVANVTADGWSYVPEALDVKTGAKLWDGAGDAMWSGASIAGDLVLFRSSSGVFGYDLTTGDKVWDSGTLFPFDYLYGRPTVAGGRIYLATCANGVRTMGPP